MNAPSLDEIRALVGRDQGDYRMDQVRELIVGEAMRRMEARIAELEARLGDVELGIVRQLDALETRIDVLASAADGDQRDAFETMAKSITDLGEQLRNMARR
ncbi:MAG: hypothetical protein ACT4OU_08635 [Hyphomicrobium sp.]